MQRKLGIETHESELNLGKQMATKFFEGINQTLRSRCDSEPYIAGKNFSIADITLLCVLDFAAGPVQIPMVCCIYRYI